MLSPIQQAFLIESVQAAKASGHIYPEMAACEAALESEWGASGLAQRAHNLFGMKQHAHPIYETIQIPTREFIGKEWITENANWVTYPSVKDCFSDRMDTLRRLSTTYPHYALALASDTPEEYVSEVSKSWSTDPARAAKCIEIFRAHGDLIRKALASTEEATA